MDSEEPVMSLKPGFIVPPWPHVRGDSVSAISLVRRIEREAHHGCGLHDVIYHTRTLAALQALLPALSPGDADTLCQCAAGRGFHLDNIIFNESRQAYHALMAKLREEQI